MPVLPPRQKRLIAYNKLQGALETLQENIIEILDLRFAPVPADIIEKVQQISERDILKGLHRAAVQVTTIHEFRNLLPQ